MKLTALFWVGVCFVASTVCSAHVIQFSGTKAEDLKALMKKIGVHSSKIENVQCYSFPHYAFSDKCTYQESRGFHDVRSGYARHLFNDLKAAGVNAQSFGEDFEGDLSVASIECVTKKVSFWHSQTTCTIVD